MKIPVELSVNSRVENAEVDCTWRWNNIRGVIVQRFGLEPITIGHLSFTMSENSTGTLVNELGVYQGCTLMVSARGIDGCN